MIALQSRHQPADVSTLSRAVALQSHELRDAVGAGDAHGLGCFGPRCSTGRKRRELNFRSVSRLNTKRPDFDPTFVPLFFSAPRNKSNSLSPKFVKVPVSDVLTP